MHPCLLTHRVLKNNAPQWQPQCHSCAQYQIGLSAEPRSVGLSAQPGSKSPTAWNFLSSDEKFSDKTSWWVTYFCNPSYRVTYNSHSVPELMIFMLTKTKTNQIASTITKSDSKNLSIQPKKCSPWLQAWSILLNSTE